MKAADFLDMVQASLGKPSRALTEPYGPLDENLSSIRERAAAAMDRVQRERSELWERLGDTATKRGWNVCRASGVEEGLAYICNVASSAEAPRVVRSDQDVFDTMPVDAALGAQGVETAVMSQAGGSTRQELKDTAAAAGVGITGVDYAVAETGSVVVLPRAGVARLASLAPPSHIAIVRPHEVVGTLDDLFLFRRLAYYEGNGNMGSYLNFITGPSRTADIEQKIVIGVHGPKEVHLVMLDEEKGG